MTISQIKYPISPWNSQSLVYSPNGIQLAKFISAHEIAMGGPMVCGLTIDDLKLDGRFSSSCIWSKDSKYLAVPKWIGSGEFRNRQNFSVYSVDEKKLYVSTEIYAVLQLESFVDMIVKGVDSPVFRTKKFEYGVEKLFQFK